MSAAKGCRGSNSRCVIEASTPRPAGRPWQAQRAARSSAPLRAANRRNARANARSRDRDSLSSRNHRPNAGNIKGTALRAVGRERMRLTARQISSGRAGTTRSQRGPLQGDSAEKSGSHAAPRGDSGNLTRRVLRAARASNGREGKSSASRDARLPHQRHSPPLTPHGDAKSVERRRVAPHGAHAVCVGPARSPAKRGSRESANARLSAEPQAQRRLAHTWAIRPCAKPWHTRSHDPPRRSSPPMQAYSGAGKELASLRAGIPRPGKGPRRSDAGVSRAAPNRRAGRLSKPDAAAGGCVDRTR